MELDKCLEVLYKGQLLPEVTIRALCFKFKELLIKESNVIHIQTPVTVVGDMHGQFHDLLEMFSIGGRIPDTNYLFLGDYVDRGLYSIETIMLLIVLKLRYPDRIHLLRGNHESRQITQSYGFYTECLNKYGGNTRVWTYLTDAFDYLVLCCIIDNELFCVHGGLSPNVQTIDQIKIIDRFREIPHDGAMADLVWSDPEENELINPENGIDPNNLEEFFKPTSNQFQVSPRGAGYTFGRAVVEKFLESNKMSRIYRAHQLCNDGYQVYFDGLVTTVWSAPNYCYRCGNKASILELYSTNKFYFNVFEEAPENKLLKENFNNIYDDSGRMTSKVINDYFIDDGSDDDDESFRDVDVFSEEYQARSASLRSVQYFL
ncbi:similar to Saccharomyces cerevisiae YNR032W PPG1 Putative serine/threonine protein phosphatase of the type 2A-like phosphatase family, required for glycogen accumulation [Maudiozyma barnettii]|uniref:Serine/threonine-protein phosphatase n=1 Tax=Maudiozyma barnettii TaxID=61262 RepID=A0A8H2VH68_9SACH|nr:putative serine/threonine-protein kinase PPG1 [Kazachstania barnettii]CAB4255417.1 similar to Saccharomyces cerevisiae YNR032W PPG1 Putative serine/threonine protein phosphatase of the type 2A-like phosphatase family, required for glycogen accumulation [Kazachstania barnettii]CAD1783837.1 similar to Saccharomyces cerevisiae YNR032W PPG1 Putative serine/threonine protein phosphatase of the type 2A-like phosphatase family, required for glycogen accumulation [Kazachstania barnettii]